MQMNLTILTALVIATMSCSGGKKQADLILSNAVVYTVDQDFSKAEAIAIKNNRIVAVGTNEEIASEYRSEKSRDMEGAFVYPGWIDAHCHFLGYGMNLSAVDVAGTSSVEEIIKMLKEHQKKNGSLDEAGIRTTGR